MASGQIDTALGPLRLLMETGTAVGMTDGQLLERFAARRDAGAEAAFAALVARHGPMVLGVCRHLLGGDEHAADDAFQAVFLVLARRARSIGRPDLLAAWLHGVAARVARKARARAERRRRRERGEVAMANVEPACTGPDPQALTAEEIAAVHEEVARLPERYRRAVVLCHFEGLTHAEAAGRLGCAPGTVGSLVSRARDLLRGRLTRRGLCPSAVLLARAMEPKAATAAVPLALERVTIQAALGFATSRAAAAGIASAAAVELARGTLKTMTVTKLTIAGAVLLTTLGPIAAGAGRIGLIPVPGGSARASQEPRAAAPAAPAKPQAPPVDREAWARKLAGLNQGDWRNAFAIGQELADLPPDEGFAILKANWEKISAIEARQQLIKAWFYAMPYPLHIRFHPRLLDGMDLGMRDRSPKVQEWAINYLGGVAFQDFAEDFSAYQAWYQANHVKPLTEVIVGSVRRFAEQAARSVKSEAPKRVQLLTRHWSTFHLPEARRAALDAGLLRTLGRWASAADAGATDVENQLAIQAVTAIGQLKPGEADLRRVVVPLIAREKPAEVRNAAILALEDEQNAWAIDLLLDVLRTRPVERGQSFSAARALAGIGDPRVIPTMIAVIEADNTYETVYGVGYFGLGKLTGVRYDESHDGAWWRRWWEKNKERYPEAVRALEIPRLSKSPSPPAAAKPAPDDPPADVADVPAQDLRAGGDGRKRYFLIGAKDAKPPAEGYGLLIVLPGGDGSADFQPFVRRIYKNVLNARWLIAEAVAPKWDEKQFDQIVWPTAASPYPSARFTTEEFIRAIVDDVRRQRAHIDPRRVILLGWSSGGPPCYAMALRQDSPVTGAFIAMSVFRPKELPALENAKGRAFYLLQSPQDRITPVRHAEAAEKALQAAGVKVHLQRYEGGHGWRGNVWAMIGEGMTWLEQQVGTK
jgi:RNA polymerase sigma factor (sigma-70 family)